MNVMNAVKTISLFAIVGTLSACASTSPNYAQEKLAKEKACAANGGAYRAIGATKRCISDTEWNAQMLTNSSLGLHTTPYVAHRVATN